MTMRFFSFLSAVAVASVSYTARSGTTTHVTWCVAAFSLPTTSHHGMVSRPSHGASSLSLSSFVPGRGIMGRVTAWPSGNSRRRSTTATTRTQLSMVIDRLSSTCIKGAQTAMDIGSSLGMTEVRNELLWAGVVAHPERATKTLADFGLTARQAEEVAVQVLNKKGLTNDSKAATSTSSTSGEQKQALPFAQDAKATLTRACQIADDMESPTVRSEHVLLALLGYNDGQPVQSIPIGDVLKAIPAIRETRQFSVTEFCNQIVQALPLLATSDDDEDGPQRTVVTKGDTGVGGTLMEIGVDWTQLALEGKLDPVYGREREIRALLRTLARRRKNNPCLIGDPGTGKTAVAEGLAQVLAQGIQELQEASNEQSGGLKPLSRMGNMMKGAFGGGGDDDKEQQEKGKQPNGDGEDEDDDDDDDNAVTATLPPCPPTLMGTRLVNIELASLVAGTASRGSLEEKLKKMIKEASENNVILFIDEIHNLIGAGGGGDGAMNAANLLKPALARGEVRVMGATTTPEYRRYIEADGALERRFQPLEIKEPTVYETLDILAALSPKYEEFHGVKYTYDALVAAAKLSDRYLNDRFLPDKAVDLLDETGSRAKISEEGVFEVTDNDVAEVISEMTGIPLGKLDRGEKARLKGLEVALEQRVKGQRPAIRSVAKSIRRARSGMRDGRRPVASFMFCGSTGVGKTELCKALAEIYFGQEKDMIRIDMSEYMDRFSTSRLIGAPPGYVGYDQGGQLTEAVRRAPHSLILFDEVEKAHEDVLNLLLQVMDDGQLTDGKGRTVSFRNNIFVMTSNVGSKELLQLAKGENDVGGDEKVPTEQVKEALEEAMKPEFLNRIDEIVVFSPLSYDNLKEIASNLIEQTVKRTLDDQNIRLDVNDNIAEIITREGWAVASMYGGRPIRRAVQRFLEDSLAEAIMDGFIEEGDSVSVNLHDPNGEKQSVIKITRELDGESVLIDVDEDDGLSKDVWSQAAYGDLPSLDDGPPKQDPGAFQ